jgi:secreted PhoX family phosphatase
MTTTPQKRQTLPLLPDGPHGSRSSATCLYRCGNACDHPEPNQSGNPHVSSVITTALERRSVLRGAGAAAGLAAGVLALGSTAGQAAAAPATRFGRPARSGRPSTDNWTPVAPNVRDSVSVPDGYRSRAVINWGDPVTAGAPEFDAWAQTPESAAAQFGYNNDYVGVLPLDRQSALLVSNHEYTNEELMFPAGVYDADTVRRIAIQSHGLSVVKIQRSDHHRSGSWRRANPGSSAYNRRITGTTEFELDGPAAGDERLKTSADSTGRHVRGTFNNCSGGTTPWGTVLSGEENFNQYFEKSGALDPRYTTQYARYGIKGDSVRGWASVDPRFDLTKEPHEPHRFGWVVELDPYAPKSTPRKHTMLGRLKHEGANIVIADNGRAVAYLGDDERGDYLYKFVSADRFDPRDSQAAKKRNMQLLTRGTLYVARLTGDGSADAEYDGTGVWIPLTSDTQSFVPAMSVADVLIFTRLAADAVVPTRMDRPEDVEPNPVNGKIYAALTNNSDRSVKYPTDEANPIASSMVRASLDAPLTSAVGNRNGYVLELTEKHGNHSGTAFTWDLLLVCGDPAAPETYFAGFDKAQVSPISCPDNVAFDSVGNLWIATDGSVLGGNDGLFRVPVAGPERGHVEQFLTVPRGAETCGPLITDDDRCVWVAVQHPGEKSGSTFDTPFSTWPHTHDFPRPGVVVSWAD